MGVYNVILSPQRCPICAAAVEWQSKRLRLRGHMLANVMDDITLEPQMDGEMHTTCHSCGAWLDAEIRDGKALPVVVSQPTKP